MSSATASALRPGARRTGTPASVAAATSTLVGSPRQLHTATSGCSNSGPAQRSLSTTTMVAPSAATRSASCSAL